MSAYLTYKLVKVGLVLLVIFVWQFWRGLNGLPVEVGQPDTQVGSPPPDQPKR